VPTLTANIFGLGSNQQNIVINFHQDFMASEHSNFFKGHTDKGQFYWPNHCGETLVLKQEEEEDKETSFNLCIKTQLWYTWTVST
jgi:hypothetical protein